MTYNLTIQALRYPRDQGKLIIIIKIIIIIKFLKIKYISFVTSVIN